MSHRRQGSRASRRQGDPSFILDDFSGERQGPGHSAGGSGGSGGPAGNQGRSKIPGPVKDHRGKNRGPKFKGKNNKDKQQEGAELTNEDRAGRESQGGLKPAEGPPQPTKKESGLPRGPLTNGVKAAGKAMHRADQETCSDGVDPTGDPKPLKGDLSVNSGSEKSEVIQSQEEPLETSFPENVGASIEEKISCAEELQRGSENVSLEQRSDAVAPEESPEVQHFNSTSSSGTESSPKEPELNSVDLSEPDGEDAQIFAHIEINYMQPVKELHTIVEETKESDTIPEMHEDYAGEGRRENTEEERQTTEKSMETMEKSSPSDSARERKTKIPSLLKEPNSRGSGNKGLRVTFDLSTTHESDEDVIESWEDLSGTDGADFAIEEDDIIDCQGKLTAIDDLLDFGEDVGDCDQLPGVEGVKEEENLQWFRPSVEFKSNAAVRKVSDKGDDVSGDDRSGLGVGDGSPGGDARSEEETEGGKPDEEACGNLPILGADTIPLSISVYNESNNSSQIPFIDGEEETCVDDDEDDEWETEPSGSSGENGDSEKGDAICQRPEKEEEELKLENKICIEEDTKGVETSKEEEQDNKHDLESKEGNKQEEAQKQEEAENKQDTRDDDEDKTLVDQPSLEEDNGEENDDLITKEDIDSVFMALDTHPDVKGVAPLARPEVLSPLGARGSPLTKTQSRTFVGPLPRPETMWDRPGSPQVSIGYECHEKKAPSVCGSETESEGELVPCEDKCIGTAEFAEESDSEPLDLSTSSSNERTASISDTTSSQSRELARSKGGEEIPENWDERVSLAPEGDKHDENAKGGGDALAVSDAGTGNSSPSPEPANEPNCLGKSESGKEKEINGKKVGKKKNKKSMREVMLEPSPVPEHILGRPKLVRGRSWREKREKVQHDCVDPLSLSFGNELCESEIVEGTSTLLTETCTEASLGTCPSCSAEMTLPTVTPGTDTILGLMTQQNPDTTEGDETSTLPEVVDAALWLSRNIIPAPPEVSIEVTAASDEDEAFHVPENEDFYIVKKKEAEKPQEVEKEYVGDSESSEEAPYLPPKEVVVNELWAAGSPLIGISLDGNQLGRDRGKDTSDSPVDSSDNSAYTDAKDSSCAETLPHSYDYVQSFPEVIGTQTLNLAYSYETDPDFDSKPDRWRSQSKDNTVVSGVEGEVDEPDVPAGDIVYEGPCSCVPREPCIGPLLPHYLPSRAAVGMGVGKRDSPLCVPLQCESDNDDVFSDDAMKLVVDSLVNEDSEAGPQDPEGGVGDEHAGENDANGTDIRSRIKEIVGPRLQRERGRPTARGGRDEGDRGADEHLLSCGESPRGGREESPLPGSSPASSSGVQGSDEMSVSRSRSRSPACKDPASPQNLPLIHIVSDVAFDPGLDSSPEKTPQVDCSFRTFRDMYQINPKYLTDSDDHEDPTESDTIVPGSGYDPDRSITVNSWGSTSDESPVPQELSSSPPLPGARGPKKVPKVTKLLRETQGIVQRWEVLQAQAVERQRQSGQVRELQRQVKSLRIVLESLIERASDTTQVENLETHHQLNDKLQELKDLQQEVKTRKGEVSTVNLAVHRFMTETGYSLTQLKDEVADLYRLWDEAHKRASSEESRLEGVEATWRLWENQADELRRALRKDGDTLKVLDAAIQTGSLSDTATASMQDVERLLNERRKSQTGKRLTLTRTQGVDIQSSTTSLGTSGDECLSDSGTSGYESCSSEELSERERRLAHLRRLARDLEASLHPNSQAWMAITKTLSSAESELKDLQKHCRDLVMRSAECLDQAKTSPQLRRRSWTKEAKGNRTGRLERRGHCALSGRDGCGRSSSIGRRGWMWRVVRAALPFQAALLLLFCVACLLEPNCCDHVNTLNLSLSPQLRYVHGPPPV